MKISDLIGRLTVMMVKHGDMPVYEEASNYVIDDVRFENGYEGYGHVRLIEGY